MDFSVIVAGPAGKGVAKAAEILAKASVKSGFYAFNYRDYPSLIRGGHNFNCVRISDTPVFSHRWDADYLLAMDSESVLKHKGRETIVLEGIDGNIVLPAKEILEKTCAPSISENLVLLGAVWRRLGFPLDPLFNVVSKELGECNAQVVRESYNCVNGEVKVSAPGSEMYFLTGNEAVALGAVASGIDVYIAYPMTPATPVLHILASEQHRYNFKVMQLENEIAVVNAALGASYAGALAMVGTSGGGFALMTEALSLQGMSEVPLVVYLAQRNAPSTGIPTYTGQGDLYFALKAGHGEFPRVVLAPGDPKEAFEMTMEAFYLAYKYRVLSILVSDKHLGESGYTVRDFSPRVVPDRFLVFPKGDYKSYEITESGVSPRAVPGECESPVRATSYEHDEYGYTTEDGQWAVKMNDKRWRKFESLKGEVLGFNPVGVYGDGNNVIVSWGSTKGAILDALRHLDGWKFVQLRYIEPFPSEEFLREVSDADNVVLVENNVTGILGRVIAENTGFLIDKKILKYDARPFTERDIVEGINNV